MDATRLRVVRGAGDEARDDREISVLISDETFDRLVSVIEQGLAPRAGLAESVFDE